MESCQIRTFRSFDTGNLWGEFAIRDDWRMVARAYPVHGRSDTIPELTAMHIELLRGEHVIQSLPGGGAEYR